jgi:hypothetical protein
MSELRLRPRSPTEIVDAAFALYRRNALQYILVVALADTPQLVVSLIQRTDLNPNLGATAFGLAISIVTYAVMSSVIARLGSTAYLGGEPDIATTVKEVLPRLGNVLLAGILKALLAIVAFVFFFFPVFYVAARWFAVQQVVVLEGAGPLAAFGRSTELSEGRKWHILLTLMLAFFIYFVLMSGIFIAFGLTGNFVLILLASTGLAVVVYPFIGLTEMVLYYDARIRAEGFDIEQMAGALDEAPASH